MFENQIKVSFNIASEASYVYILSGQKYIKDAKNYQFDELSLQLNSVTRNVNFKMTKLLENAKIQNATFWVNFKHYELASLAF